MTAVELANTMRSVATLLRKLEAEMDAESDSCSKCGLTVRRNLADHQARLAYQAARSRVEKLLEQLQGGNWPGRELLPVVQASDERERDDGKWPGGGK